MAVETSSRFFWRTPFKDEVDFILEDFNGQKICPVEVKYKNTVVNKDARNIIKFCIKNNLSEGIIITKDLEDRKILMKNKKKIKIKFIPAWKFLLSCP